MSFDVFFHTCNLGTRTKIIKNRFTGKSSTTFDDPGLSDDERTAVKKLLKALKAKGPDEFGAYTFSFADGGEAVLCADGWADNGKMDGCSVQTHCITAVVINFLFRLSKTGNMVISPAICWQVGRMQ